MDHLSALKGDQRFLIDDRILDMEVDAAGISHDEVLLEIGGGTGNLTSKLLKKTNSIIVVEKDDRLYNILLDKFGSSGATIIHGDFLKLDLKNYRIDKIVSNIPYDLSTPILYRIYTMQFKLAVLVLQKEFADRLVAKSGTKQYGRMTVTSYLYADISMLFHVPRYAFMPVPNVDSAAVKIIPSNKVKSCINLDYCMNMLNIFFSHRRKKIGTVVKRYIGMDPQKIDSIAEMERRIEDLPPSEIIQLINKIYRLSL